MLITYEEFCDLLIRHIDNGEDFFSSLLKTVIDNPSRYCGLFRLSNAKTKLIQNVTQSNEIKFGDFLEELTTEYLSRLGFVNYDKDLGFNSQGDRLNIDQYFRGKDVLYIVEQKVRDDHDSTKKRGQYSNFQKKIDLIKSQHPNIHICACMWFVDDGLVKNRNYYRSEMAKENYDNVELHLFYGGEFFNFLTGSDSVWNEISEKLRRYRVENALNTVEIPEFGTSKQILDALIHLDDAHWRKLFSNTEKYVLLREELFGQGNNLEIAMKTRRER